jgi:hypothetical protein
MIWRFSEETARALDIRTSEGFTGRCSCNLFPPGSDGDHPGAHADGCERKAVLLLERAAHEIAQAAVRSRPDRLIIAPPAYKHGERACGCPPHACLGHPLRPVIRPGRELTEAELTAVTAKFRAAITPADGDVTEEEWLAAHPEQQPASWQDEFFAVMGEPVGAAGYDLPSYEAVPAGACRDCHTGPVYKAGQCVYCYALADLREPGPAVTVPGCDCSQCRRHAAKEAARAARQAPALRFTSEGIEVRRPASRPACACSGSPHRPWCPRYPDERRFARRGAVLLGLSLVLLVLAVHVWAPLFLVAFWFAVAGMTSARRARRRR